MCAKSLKIPCSSFGFDVRNVRTCRRMLPIMSSEPCRRAWHWWVHRSNSRSNLHDSFQDLFIMTVKRISTLLLVTFLKSPRAFGFRTIARSVIRGSRLEVFLPDSTAREAALAEERFNRHCELAVFLWYCALARAHHFCAARSLCFEISSHWALTLASSCIAHFLAHKTYLILGLMYY